TGWRDEAVAMVAVPDLVPALVAAFANQAEHAIEMGLLQGYTETDDSLTVLRGRLREQDQLRRRSASRSRCLCGSMITLSISRRISSFGAPPNCFFVCRGLVHPCERGSVG